MAEQCPDCGATFRPGEVTCPGCGLELTDDQIEDILEILDLADEVRDV